MADPKQVILGIFADEAAADAAVEALKTWDDDNADGTFHKIKQRHATGFDDWRGAYGSPGA